MGLFRFQFKKMSKNKRTLTICYESCVFLIQLIDLIAAFSHQCIHEIPRPEQVIFNVHIESFRVMRKRSLDQRLRIHLVYDQSVASLSSHKQRLVKYDLIPNAVSYWESTLRVRHTGGPIRLLRQCVTDRVRYRDDDPMPFCVDGCSNMTFCGDTPVPDEHLDSCRETDGRQLVTTGQRGNGVDNTDFILYVSAKSMERCSIGTTVAYAAYCQLEDALDRPVAGYVNLCPESISTKAHDVHQMHSTIKHEILHALGFSAGLYAFFRDSHGNPLTPRSKATGKPVYNTTIKLYQWSDRVVRTFVRPDWRVRNGSISKTIQMLVTPNVVREVQRHFNCSTIEGAELEDQGVIGTALTHWEKRVFENEVMTGTYTQNPIVSRVTLALMEDTGWYKVRYENAEPYHWGRNLGCEFLKESCLDWMTKKEMRGERIHPYCDRVKTGVLQTECTEERDAVALCNLIEYDEPLPNKYQHFEQLAGIDMNRIEHYAGSVVLADFCPYIQEFNWQKEEMVVRGSRCSIRENNADPDVNYSLEKYGRHSKCFDHSGPWSVQHCASVHQVLHWGSGCYQYNCSLEHGLTIRVRGHSFRCYMASQVLDISVTTTDWLHQGTILCPPCTEICSVCPQELNPLEFEALQKASQPLLSQVPCTGSHILQVSPSASVILGVFSAAFLYRGRLQVTG